MTKLPITLTLILLTLLIVGCSPPPDSVPVAAPAPAEPALSSGDTVLEIIGLEESKSLKMAELQALAATQGWGGTKSSAGMISPPQQLKGSTITALADLVGGLESGMGVSVVAKDGYAMTMSYEQIAEGDYITYDPGTGDENRVEGPLQTIVAYERDGEPISADDDGPLRLFIVSEENDNVVDGHWTVKWVTKIKLKPMSEEWSLNLEGAITEAMDRNSFESCSAPGCHRATWTDEDGREWSGVPLYYLAGRVDDDVRHEDRAYNDDLAKAGYVMQFFAADGYNVGIDSSRTNFNHDVFVASMIDGEPLDEKYFPLRLVGESIEKGEMIGQIAQIVLQPNEGVTMSSDEPIIKELAEEPAEMVLPDGAAVMVLGQVMNKLALGMENLQAMNVVNLEAEHPKKGLQNYQGVHLNDLLSLAGADPDAMVMVIVAADGYKAEVGLSDVRNCADCLIAFGGDGGLNMVMPGLESNFWVKQVNFLEIK